jgi:hypothetical protein
LEAQLRQALNKWMNHTMHHLEGQQFRRQGKAQAMLTSRSLALLMLCSAMLCAYPLKKWWHVQVEKISAEQKEREHKQNIQIMLDTYKQRMKAQTSSASLESLNKMVFSYLFGSEHALGLALQLSIDISKRAHSPHATEQQKHAMIVRITSGVPLGAKTQTEQKKDPMASYAPAVSHDSHLHSFTDQLPRSCVDFQIKINLQEHSLTS